MNFSNPFDRFKTEPVLRRERRSIFPVRTRGPQTEGEIIIARKRTEEQRGRELIGGKVMEHMHSIHDLRDYLAEPRQNETPIQRRERETACANSFTCNPWKYEPLLLDDLIQARVMESPQDIHKLRGIIRAGSWNTYERESIPDILKRLKHLRDIVEFHRRALTDPRDTSTTREHLDDLDEELEGIDKVIADVSSGVIGEPLEVSVRTIEDINVTTWHKLKQHHIIRGERPQPDRPDTLTKQLYQELALIRPIRDLLYLRRLYPVLAHMSVQPNMPVYVGRKNLAPPPLRNK